VAAAATCNASFEPNSRAMPRKVAVSDGAGGAPSTSRGEAADMAARARVVRCGAPEVRRNFSKLNYRVGLHGAVIRRCARERRDASARRYTLKYTPPNDEMLGGDNRHEGFEMSRMVLEANGWNVADRAAGLLARALSSPRYIHEAQRVLGTCLVASPLDGFPAPVELAVGIVFAKLLRRAVDACWKRRQSDKEW
jgi:hypothetical protein